MSNKRWATLDIEITKWPTNEANPWEPTPDEIVSEILGRIGYQDLDTGWAITQVLSTTDECARLRPTTTTGD